MKRLGKMRIPANIMRVIGWNKGGTLHQATVAQWHRSDFENGLATCADWVAAIRNSDGTTTPDGGTLRAHLSLNLGNKSMYPEARKELIDDQEFRYSLRLLVAVTQGTAARLDVAGEMQMSNIAMTSAAALGYLTIEYPEGAGPGEGLDAPEVPA